MNELMIFEGNDVEVFELNGEVLFNPRDVAKCLNLGDSAIRMAIGKMSDKQVIKVTNSDVHEIPFRKLNNAGENFLTESGVCVLISRSINISQEKKYNVIESFQQQGYLKDIKNIVLTSRVEIEFLDTLQQTLDVLDYTLEKQYNVDGYRIDAYIEDLKIAIEYDELHHLSAINTEKDEKRQKYIKNELGCTFVRCDIRNTHSHNTGLVMKAIMNR